MKTTRKVDKREQHIKKKLTAAILMLLISSIMTVTSTYAWFTLSTAPEIKGIQTTIGGNGNLEIALATADTWDNPESILTINGTNNASVTDTNTTWGNLVDLSDEKYGLRNITLYPSELNVIDGKVNLDAQMLKVPSYGPDGRITTLNADRTVAGVYNDPKFTTLGKGVRAIGTPSGMSDRELAYRNAFGAIDQEKNSALVDVQTSLNQTDGGTLAGVAIKHGIANNGDDRYTKDEVISIGNLISGLRDSLDHIEQGLKEAINGYMASEVGQQKIESDDEYLAFKSFLGSVDLDTATITNSDISFTFAFGEGNKTVTVSSVSSSLISAISKYQTASTSVKNAQDAYDTINLETVPADGYTWDDIKDSMSPLINIAGVKVNGFTVSEVKDDISGFASNVMSNGGIIVELNSGSGVYYEIAELIGNYSSLIIIPEVAYGGTKLENVKATISTKNPNEAMLVTEYNNVILAGSPVNNTAAEDKQITDFYGYIIDFFVRTNASEATLMLSDAQQRIYTDSTDERTLGGGSVMKFTSSSIDFGIDEMKRLMGAIKIVFIDGSGQVIANAKLDVENSTQVGSEVSARIKVVKIETNETVDGEGNKTTTTTETLSDDIMKLVQNETTKLSVLVYLDGNGVQNDDVANAINSMSGTLNLQFKTDATLKPMEYKDLHIQGENNTDNDASGENAEGSGS